MPADWEAFGQQLADVGLVGSEKELLFLNLRIDRRDLVGLSTVDRKELERSPFGKQFVCSKAGKPKDCTKALSPTRLRHHDSDRRRWRTMA